MPKGLRAIERARLPNPAQRVIPHCGQPAWTVPIGAEQMKKFLILLVVLLVAVAGAAVWLAGLATSGKPDPGEIRLEVQDVF